MTDVVDAAKRSSMMAGIKTRNTQPEIAVRQGLHRTGLRFRLSGQALPGSPDLTLPKHCTAVFVHGCFWHAHLCADFHLPSTNTDFWRSKLTANVNRDIACTRALQRMGWRVLVFWECAIKFARAREETAALFRAASDWVINYDQSYLEFSKGRRHVVSKRRGTSRSL